MCVIAQFRPSMSRLGHQIPIQHVSWNMPHKMGSSSIVCSASRSVGQKKGHTCEPPAFFKMVLNLNRMIQQAYIFQGCRPIQITQKHRTALPTYIAYGWSQKGSKYPWRPSSQRCPATGPRSPWLWSSAAWPYTWARRLRGGNKKLVGWEITVYSLSS